MSSGLRHRPARQSLTNIPVIAQKTGPLEPLATRRVLVLADVENLCYGAQRHLRQKIRFGILGRRFHANAGQCALHAFFSSSDEDEGYKRYLESKGWTVHQRAIETVQTYQGRQRLANIDSLLIFQAGVLISRSSAELIVIASGDGTLVCDLAKAIANLPKPRRVMTLSLAGSTSRRLDATRNRHIHTNIELGLDCLQPIIHAVR